jgi:predicted CXXCH cytochrome family protein
MRNSTAASLAAAAALLVAAHPVRADLRPHGTGAPYDTGCALATADRLSTTTRECLTCHDGTLGNIHFATRGDHPVDVSYDGRLGGTTRLRPRFEVSRRLVMPDGQVRCVTCHDGASTERAHVAVSLAGSGLCRACHGV